MFLYKYFSSIILVILWNIISFSLKASHKDITNSKMAELSLSDECDSAALLGARFRSADTSLLSEDSSDNPIDIPSGVNMGRRRYFQKILIINKKVLQTKIIKKISILDREPFCINYQDIINRIKLRQN